MPCWRRPSSGSARPRSMACWGRFSALLGVRLTTTVSVKLTASATSPRRVNDAGALLVSRAMAQDTISFARGAPSADILPKEAVRDAAARALAEDWQKALSYGTGIGHP